MDLVKAETRRVRHVAGKSTLVNHLFSDKAETIVFDPAQDVRNARRDPELFLRLNPPPLVLDEIQFAPELLGALKRLVDERPGEMGQYILTGSQQFQVLRRVQESLAGRAGLIDLFSMSQREIQCRPGLGLVDSLFASSGGADLFGKLKSKLQNKQATCGLLERLFRGGYPSLLRFETEMVPEWFDAYFRTYIERDVKLLRNFNDAHDFSRFVRVMAALTAQELNASHLGREIGITPRTARGWMEALVASYQVVVFNAFSGNTIKRVSGRAKVHLTDTGMATHLLTVSTPKALQAQPNLGNLFESYVVMEMVKQSQALVGLPRFWHWRSVGGAEVDLIIERDGVFFPVEVKLKSHPNRRDTRGLTSLVKSYPNLSFGPRIVVHGGTDLDLLDENTVGVPVDLL